MDTFNIISYISENKIDKVTNIDDNKLIIKIQENFTEEEQKLYVASLYSYLNYDEFTDFVINLDDICHWFEFSQKAIAKELLMKNFKENDDYKLLHVKLQGTKKDGEGEHNKETILLNIYTFRLFCVLVGTEKSNQMYKCYVRLKYIFYQTIKEEREELKNQMEQLENYKNKLLREKHNLLLGKFGSAGSGSLIYIVKVKTIDNSAYVIKICESENGLCAKFEEHKSSYEEYVILDCFMVKRSKDFETFIHSHELISPNKITNLKGHENEGELFLIGEKLSYDVLLNIIKTNIFQFDGCNQELEIEKIKLEKENIIAQTNIKTLFELLNYNKILSNKIENLEKKIDAQSEKINSLQIKNTTNFIKSLKTLEF